MGFRAQNLYDEDIAYSLDNPEELPIYVYTRRNATIQERFERLLELHPEIYEEFKRIALGLYARGREHYGSKAIIEIVRYNRAMSGADDVDPFKINNDFSSRFARRLATEDVRFKDFFEFRGLKTA